MLSTVPAFPSVRTTAFPTSSVCASSNAPRIVAARSFTMGIGGSPRGMQRDAFCNSKARLLWPVQGGQVSEAIPWNYRAPSGTNCRACTRPRESAGNFETQPRIARVEVNRVQSAMELCARNQCGGGYLVQATGCQQAPRHPMENDGLSTHLLGPLPRSEVHIPGANYHRPLVDPLAQVGHRRREGDCQGTGKTHHQHARSCCPD